MPVTSCGMRPDDEAVRVAIGLRLGLELCVPHQCHYRAQVDAFGRHAFVCKKAAGRSIRPYALNQLVARAVSAAAIPNTKESQGLCRSGGKWRWRRARDSFLFQRISIQRFSGVLLHDSFVFEDARSHGSLRQFFFQILRDP